MNGSATESTESSAAWLPPGVRVVPVVVVQEAKDASRLCEALRAGGLPCAEITLRTPAGLKAIEAAAGSDGFSVGAGTVLNGQQAREVISAGAQFIVSPGFDDGVWQVGLESGVPVIPGVATATETQRAVNAGARVVKFFPAATSGGIAGLKALAAPFGQLRFMPTGGITVQTAPDWLAVDAVLAVGGSWLTPPALLTEGRFDDITQLARNAVDALKPTHG